jgi:hypothetical protein
MTEELTLTITLPADTWETLTSIAYSMDHAPDDRRLQGLEAVLEILPKPRYGPMKDGVRGPIEEDYPLYAMRYFLDILGSETARRDEARDSRAQYEFYMERRAERLGYDGPWTMEAVEAFLKDR